jgi:acetyl-CoA carboxylase biotin carboxyl carrier protein
LPVNGDPDLDLVSSLAEILNKTGLTEIEIDRRGTKFRVAKTITAMATVNAGLPPAAHNHMHVAPIAETAAPGAAKSSSGDHPGAVKSPMVGTVYKAP